MNITYKHINEIKPYANNPRKNDKEIKAITINSKNEIVAGYALYEKYQKRHYTFVPCHYE